MLEERVNLNRRWWRASAVRVRVLAAALALVAAGCMVLGWGSRASRATAASSSARTANPLTQASAFPTAAQLRNAKHIAPAQAQSLLAGLPLIFEPNQGQANLDPHDERAQFIARGSGYSLFLGSEGAVLGLESRQKNSSRTEFLQMKLAGANPHAVLTAAEPLPGKTNYLLGNDPTQWRHSIPQFARVRYENLYPGINLVFYGNQGRLEYDFQVAPGADPKQAELEFSGAQKLKVQDGALIITGRGGDLRFEAPHIYQQIAGREQAVAGSFVLRGAHRAGFTVGPYDRSRELVIDPQLVYTTYFGGAGNELATSVAVLSPYIYITGSTTSTSLPTPTSGVLPYQGTLNGTQNIYVAVINPTVTSPVSSQLVYLTYLGGNGVDSPVGISVDGGGNAYVAGTTSSTNFPYTSNAYQRYIYLNSTGTTHVFASVLNPTLSALNYSTYLSGNGNDYASGMTNDAAGHLYVTGTTTSNNGAPNPTNADIQFPASAPPNLQAIQLQSYAATQFFVTDINTVSGIGASSITFSTYFGGGSTANGSALNDTGGQIAVDSNENIYFTGTTNFIYVGGISTDFPILNAYQPCLDQPPPTIIINPPTCSYSSGNPYYSNPDAFVAKINPTAPSPLQFSTYLGGSQSDSGTGIAVDTSGNVYVTGTTNSPDFVASTSIVSFAPFQQCLNNQYTNTSGTINCTETISACTPGEPCGYDNDAFTAKLSAPASGSTTTNVELTYFSYLGGSGNEYGNAITVDTGEGAVLTGSTNSPFISNGATPPGPASGSFPATACGEIECNLVGAQDAFIARLNTETQDNQQNPAANWATYFGSGTPSTAMTVGTGVTLDPYENYYIVGDTNSTSNLPGGGGFQSTNAGGYDAFVTELKPDSGITVTGVLSLGNNQTYVSAGNQATFIYTVTNTGPDIAPGLTITDSLVQTGVAMVPNSISVTGGLCNTVNANSSTLSCTINSLQAGSIATVTIVLTPTQNQQGQSQTFNGGSVSVTGPNNILFAQTIVYGNMADYSITANPSNVTVQAGNTGSYQVQLSPQGIFSSNISLSYALAATGTSCTYTTPTVTLNGASPASSTLNCVTTPRPVIPTARIWTRQFYAMWLSFPGLAVLGLCVGGKRRRIAGMMLGLILALVLFLPSCSQPAAQPPSTGTPAGTYTLTVTATSGSDVKNYTVTLTVT
jgi:uncharacterized repeat protein (TIGR01451 family)